MNTERLARNPISILFLVLVVALLVVLITATTSPAASMGAAIAVVLFLGLWAKDPPIFVLIAGSIYAATQAMAMEESALVVGSVPLNGAQMFVVLITGALVARMGLDMALTGRHPVLPHCLLPFALLVISAGFRSVGGEDQVQAFAATARMLACLIVLAFASFTATSMRTVYVYLMTGAIVAVVASFSAFAEALLGRGTEDVIRAGAVRAGGSFGGAVPTGNVAFLGIPAFVGRWMAAKSKWSRGIAGACLFLVGLGLFSTFTRRTLVGAAIFILTYFWPVAKDRGATRVGTGNKIAIILLTVVAISAGILSVDQKSLDQRLSDIPGLSNVSATDEGIGSGRGLIWRAMIQGLRQNSIAAWLVGNGTLSSIENNRRFAYLELTAHNSYLELLFNQGIVGLGLYLWFALALFRALRSVVRQGGAIGMLADVWSRYWVAYLLSVEMFGSSIYRIESRWYMMAIMGAIIGYGSRLARESNNSKR